MKFKQNLTTKQWLILSAALILAAAGLAAAFFTGRSVKKPEYDAAVAAARQMQLCMDEIKAEKLARGIEIVPEDRFETGLIGEDYNFITTTLGDIEAKRTTADANMAAVMVFMLREAGLKAGDTLGGSFSGSFPAMNIATLCACDALGINCVYISSCGASNWGANNPGFCFPEMAVHLYENGLISTAPALITPGGGDDVGGGVDSVMFSELWDRVLSLGYPTMSVGDYRENLALRKQLFDSSDIDCFIAVGGNITSLGYNMIAPVLGQGILHEEIGKLNGKSGLLEEYLFEGLPTILILNIRQLAADWGFTFDPEQQESIGTGSIYYETQYNTYIILAALAAELALWVLYRKEQTANAENRH